MKGSCCLYGYISLLLTVCPTKLGIGWLGTEVSLSVTLKMIIANHINCLPLSLSVPLLIYFAY